MRVAFFWNTYLNNTFAPRSETLLYTDPIDLSLEEPRF
jgi:hypothetical protein